jgi:DNA-binding MarR family transcriptional regulator
MKHTVSFHTIKLGKKIQKVIGYKDPPLSLSNSEASALMFIDSSTGASQSDIASHLHLEPATVVTLIDVLERKRLVRREKQTNGDRRKYRIILTPGGKEAVEKVEYKTLRLEKYLKNNIDPKELKSFTQTLAKITGLLDRMKGGENEISDPKRHLAP